MGLTAAFCLFGLVGIAVVGWPVHASFLSYHLPRLESGEAFSFFKRGTFYVARNLGAYGLPVKLGWLGVPGLGHGAANAFAWAYGLVVLGLAWWAGRRPSDRVGQVVVVLALVDLAALRSPLAPGAYASAGFLWMAALWWPAWVPSRGWAVASALVAALVVHGPPPLPAEGVELVFGIVQQVVIIALGVGALVWAARRGSSAAGPSP